MSNENPVKLAIVGGGAAGMFAAAVAADFGIPSVLIERKARLGSKVLMTANGRCNFTKDLSPEQFLKDLNPLTAFKGDATLLSRQSESTSSFVAEAIRDCPPRKIIAGFKSLNVPLRRMPDGRMFPADGKAATIVHAFGDLLRDAEVPILTNCPVRGVSKLNGDATRAEAARPTQPKALLSRQQKNNSSSPHPRFIVHTKNFDFLAENVLLATGGVSYPKTGSVGDGQNFAKALGHKLVPYRPGLIGLETDDPRVTRFAGQRFEDDGRCKVLDGEGRVLFDYRGEVDCERFGLSGAAIYNAQRFIEHYKRQCEKPSFAASPTTEGRLRLQIEVWFGRNRLTFPLLKPRPVKEAIVTLGGVDTREIDPHTMESKLCPGLYFAGEVMDIDGPTGGYNLTLAFATARKAVASVARRS